MDIQALVLYSEISLGLRSKILLSDGVLQLNIEDETLARFKELVEEKKIEEKDIVNFLESGNRAIHFHNISYQETI